MQKQTTDFSEILNNIELSCRMEGLTLTEELRSFCLAIANGSRSLQDCLTELNSKYHS